MCHYPLNTKFLKKKSLIQKPWKISGVLWKFHFLKIPDAPTTNKRSCRMHDVQPMAHRVNPDNFWRKWVGSIVLQKSAAEISEVRSAILKKCAVDVFRSDDQYLAGAYWSFNLEEVSEVRSVHWPFKSTHWQISEKCWFLKTAHWPLRSAHWQRIWEVRTGLWKVRTDVQEGRSDV